MKTTINAKSAQWSAKVRKLWRERVVPRFKEGESCSAANYFTSRPYSNEYDRGSKMEGFVYTVQPGNRVAFVEWIP